MLSTLLAIHRAAAAHLADGGRTPARSRRRCRRPGSASGRASGRARSDGQPCSGRRCCSASRCCPWRPRRREAEERRVRPRYGRAARGSPPTSSVNGEMKQERLAGADAGGACSAGRAGGRSTGTAAAGAAAAAGTAASTRLREGGGRRKGESERDGKEMAGHDDLRFLLNAPGASRVRFKRHVDQARPTRAEARLERPLELLDGQVVALTPSTPMPRARPSQSSCGSLISSMSRAVRPGLAPTLKSSPLRLS